MWPSRGNEAEVACFLLKHKVLDAKDIVEYISKGNRNITLLEMKRKVGGGFGFSTRWVILNELKDAGIKEITEVKVKEIINNHSENGQINRGVVYEKDGQEHFIKADSVIIAVDTAPTTNSRTRWKENFQRRTLLVIASECVPPSKLSTKDFKWH